ncbi:MAG: LacI family DNA-binding transcriptional regulator, partial [Pseudomonadota bacterium]
MSDAGRRPTILDVANRAGVAVGTVSNVLNGTRPVSETRRRRVLDAAETLGFQPNSLAQGLRRQRSGLVGLCLPHSSSAYFASMAEMFEAVVAKQGFELLQVLTHQDKEREERRIAALLARQIDGLILVPSLEPDITLSRLDAARLPTILVDRSDPQQRFDSVTLDNRRAMRAIAEHLAKLGHRRLLFIVQSLTVMTTQDRIAGLDDMLNTESGIVAARVEEWPAQQWEYNALLEGQMGRAAPPTAIIAGNSNVALATIKAMRQLGIACPEGVSLAAFDDPAWSEIVTPGLTVVHQTLPGKARHRFDRMM